MSWLKGYRLPQIDNMRFANQTEMNRWVYGQASKVVDRVLIIPGMLPGASTSRCFVTNTMETLYDLA